MDQDEKFQAVNNQHRLIILDGLAVSDVLREKIGCLASADTNAPAIITDSHIVKSAVV
jgi:hypothetical protein